VTKALPTADVLPAAVALATDIAVNAAPVSVAVAKRLLWEAMDKSVAEVSAMENRLFRTVTSLPDAREGIAAFVEKRIPVWAGRVSTDTPA